MAKTHSHSHRSKDGGAYEVFVGDLSYFACERDLRELFGRVTEVLSASVIRKEDGLRSRSFGFVKVPSYRHGVLALRCHGVMFMGRRIRVELREASANHARCSARKAGYEMCVKMSAAPHTTCAPREDVLRAIFAKFGVVEDVAVKQWAFHSDAKMFDGYAFVIFRDVSSALALLNVSLTVHGFALHCRAGQSFTDLLHGPNGAVLEEVRLGVRELWREKMGWIMYVFALEEAEARARAMAMERERQQATMRAAQPINSHFSHKHRSEQPLSHHNHAQAHAQTHTYYEPTRAFTAPSFP